MKPSSRGRGVAKERAPRQWKAPALQPPAARVRRMQDALEMVLLFHSAGEWSAAKQKRWHELAGNREPCTRTVCDYAREALKREKDESSNHV